MNIILSLAFEALNGFLLVVLFAAVVFFAAYLYRRVKVGVKWQHLNIAVALLLALVGDAVIRAPVWYYRHLVNRHGYIISHFSLNLFAVVVMIGSAIGSIGLLYLIHAATPDKWRPWPAVLTLVLALGFVALELLG